MKKVIDRLAKRFGYVPARRDYAAAQMTRLTADWITQSQSIDSKTRMGLEVLRARSRDMVENNSYAQKFMTMLHSNVLGDCGMTMKCKATRPRGARDQAARDDVEEAWWEWGKKGNCTVDGHLSFADVQALSLSSIGRDGECLIRIVTPWPNKWNFALQLIESDLLDLTHNESALSGGRQVRMGVELDQWQRPIAYHLLQNYRNDLYSQRSVADRVRVPAREIIHPYMLKRIGQTRGLPWMTPALLHLKMLAGYEEAEVVAARTAACKMGFLTPSGELDYQGPEICGGKAMDAEPGHIEQLLQGMDIKTLDWNHPNSMYGEFVKSCLRTIAAGLNVSYNILANDLESVNFSSARIGLQSERDFWRCVQKWFGESMAEPIFNEWLSLQLMTPDTKVLPGYTMADKDRIGYCEWHGRRWEWVDPAKDIAAKISELNSGMTSHTRLLAERGIDRDELFDEIMEDRLAAEARGLIFPELESKQDLMEEEDGGSEPDDEDDDDDDEEEEESEDKRAAHGPRASAAPWRRGRAGNGSSSAQVRA